MKYILGATKKNLVIRLFGLMGVLGVLIALLFVSPMLQTKATGQRHDTSPKVDVPGDLSTYMGSNARTGYNGAETIINAGNVSTLHKHWTYSAGGSINTQVVVVNGTIYWGSWDGYEHATNLDGTPKWQSPFLGTTTPKVKCSPASAGVASTATVGTVSINGVPTEVVFVGGGDANFYALNAADGSILWKAPLWQTSLAQSSYMLWAGSALYTPSGSTVPSIYVGISSYGDCPLVPGQLFRLDATAGTIQKTFNVTAKNCQGGGIWDAPAIDEATGKLYVSTGTIGTCSTYENLAYGLLELDTTNLTLLDNWQIPINSATHDSDFGSTPTLFTMTDSTSTTHQMVGLANKNGIYYALDRTNLKAGPVWSLKVSNGKSSIASSAWDGTSLYVANAAVTLNGVACTGTVRVLNPATGATRWQVCTPGKVVGAVTVIPGLVIVGAGKNIIILDAATGQQKYAFHDPNTSGTAFWGNATVSNGVLYFGNQDRYLYALGL